MAVKGHARSLLERKAREAERKQSAVEEETSETESETEEQEQQSEPGTTSVAPAGYFFGGTEKLSQEHPEYFLRDELKLLSRRARSVHRWCTEFFLMLSGA
jgi:CRISPR/Cas system CSM-associated protein Csm3 (group 7 of RAMP superfamily)